MKRKIFLILFAAIAALCLVFGLSACDNGDSGDDKKQPDTTQTPSDNTENHTHNYGALQAAVPSTCAQKGVKAHYYCAGCGKYFDEQKNETTLKNLQLPLAQHEYGALQAAVSPTCVQKGVKAHYHCEVCGKYFDVQKNETTLKNLQLSLAQHEYGALQAAVSPTCVQKGVKAHYHCEVCGKYFDEQKKETTLEKLQLPLIGHSLNLGKTKCSVCNIPLTVGLEYTLTTIYGETGYLVSKGTATDADIIIPSIYNGIPVKKIGDEAFYSCTSLTSVTIPNSVTIIGNYAFYGCSSLTSVTISAGVTSIGNYAFYNCTSIISITIPNGVTQIGNHAFYNCTSLISITIPNGVTQIGNSAFNNCTSLASVIIPEGVTKIDINTFNGCKSLTSVTIPEGVTSIGNSAFNGCYRLAEVYNNSSLNILKGYSGIYGGIAYYAFYVYGKGETQSKLKKQDGFVFYDDADGTYLLRYEGEDTDITLPNYSKNYKIWQYAFGGCTALTSVTIPEGVTEIGISAFNGCTSLTSVTIPDSVIEISNYAFEGCHHLAEVYNNSLLNIHKGGSTYGGIAYYAVHVYGKGETQSKLKKQNDFVFYDDTDGVYLVRYEGEDTDIILPNYNKNYKIWQYAFYKCTALTSVTIPEGVTEIGRNAFDGCTSLTRIDFNGTVDEWNAIKKGDDWNKDMRYYIVGCTNRSFMEYGS